MNDTNQRDLDSILVTTPPDSFSETQQAPPTPPQTDPKTSHSVTRILDLLRRHSKAVATIFLQTPWHRFKLQPSEYEQLLSLLRAEPSLWHFVQNKVRYDYFAANRSFIIRMPTQLHDSFIANVTQEIVDQVKRMEKCEDLAVVKFAKLIRNTTTGKLDLPEVGEHQPDGSFKHKDARWPGVILEVAYSQKRRDLAHLADDYIIGTEGNVRVVMGIDIEYQASKRATVSMWKGGYSTEGGELYYEAKQTVKSEAFRDVNGCINPDRASGLTLQLKDFAPESISKELPDNSPSIFIPSMVLHQFLLEAEANARDTGKVGAVDTIVPGAKKRRRFLTPEDELLSEDERAFMEMEDRDAKRVAKEDRSYAP